MYYKEDWEKAKENLQAFWDGEDIGRPLAAIFAPRTARCPRFPELHNGPWTGPLLEGNFTQEEIDHWWRDPEENRKRMRYWFENTYFGGEAVPAAYVNWGASAAAAFFGAEPKFHTSSVWYPRVIETWEDWKWEFDEKTNKWWNNIWDIVECLEEQAEGRYLVGMPEFGNAADNLSLMRGMDSLAEDCLDEPERILEAMEYMEHYWRELHEKLYQKTKRVNFGGGVLPWMSLWAPGRIDQLACDFSTILSPSLFRELFVKDIQLMGEWTEYGTYHLDGRICMRNHLDTLLELDCIKAIEFTPGAGQLPTLSEEYIPRYQRILEKGKRLYLLAQPNEVEALCKLLPRRGLYLCVSVDSREAADEMLNRMYAWSK
ncbi:MAG: hypothetical protein HFI32_06510 [Lachnospiraceae bacterium]|nr:hypothetical protein [Lachnospiraceae bacterium]